ncbi:diphthine--ammonia ligase [Anoplophora glabripennis]|nr:diphthine--ammonia ligase [Anoplophora glabripennis]XP_018564792.1 diphthine--ammonia ligase [Anoplophora glabripennis]XP_018564793.1 diphthine--ammonia ligase [Anoplophora glabripennis]
MRVVALISGGKDSTFNMMQCIAAGHEIVALANLVPHSRTEIDSYMYQSVGHEAIDLIAAAMDLPLYKKETLGISNEKGRTYKPSENDEVEDLYLLLETVKNEISVDAVSVGAILSDYQRVRVENVCSRLRLTPLAYLWRRNQEELLDEMIKCEVDAIVIKVAALGLESKHLGRSLSLLQPHLIAMHEKYGLNVCGEGGEYETLTLDCPLFKSRIVVEDSVVILHSNDPIAPVGYLKFNKLVLEIKLPALDLHSRLEGLPLKDSDGYVTDQGEEAFEIIENEEDEPKYNETATNSSEVNYLNETIAQRPTITTKKSKEGWLWLGGVQGTSLDPSEAMDEAMSILKSLLSENIHTVQDVCSISMFVSDMSQYAALNELYVEMFNHVNPPSRACVQVPFDQTCPVRIEALSWKQSTKSSGDRIIERHTMHVQSRSHWAPSNIGPYSQSVRVGDFVHLAGQIGLVPGSMEMVAGGIKSQCQLALRHLKRLLMAVDSNFNLRDVVQGICYVTDISYVERCRKLWEERTNNAIVDYVVVTGLPRDALVEWHVWAHKYNNQFEYEERGKCVDNFFISIYRRWNYDNNIAAILCRVDHPQSAATLDNKIFTEAMDYTIQKLKQGHEDATTSIFNIKIFYSVTKSIECDSFNSYFEDHMEDSRLSYTLVPVVSLKNSHTYLSICGVRFQ